MSPEVSPPLPDPIAPAPVLVPDTAPTRRLGSIDAYRGLVMFLMMAEVAALLRRSPSAVTGNRDLGVPLPSPVARRVGRLRAPRHDPAVVLVPGRRGAAVLAGQPAGAGPDDRA